MNDEQKPKHAFARSRSNAGLGLPDRISAHLRQLAPHMIQRDGVVLLREANTEIERLRAAIERLGSMEAFTFSRAVDKARDEELLARIDYARSVLTPNAE